MDDEGDFRTAPAKLGLLITEYHWDYDQIILVTFFHPLHYNTQIYIPCFFWRYLLYSVVNFYLDLQPAERLLRIQNNSLWLVISLYWTTVNVMPTYISIPP